MVVINCFLLCGCGRELKTEVTRTAVLKKMTGYCPEVDSPMSWGCQLQFLYICWQSPWNVWFFATWKSYIMIMWVLGALEKMKKETNMTWTSVEFYWSAHCVTKLWCHFFRCIAFASMTNRTLWTWIWCCCIWYIRFQLNSFQLQISLEKSNLLTHIDFLLASYFCRVKWTICTNNFHFLLVSLTYFSDYLQLSFCCIYFSLCMVSWEMMDRGFTV
jgi:hypothetical protein